MVVGVLVFIFIKCIFYEFDLEVICIVDNDLNSDFVLLKYENIFYREISGLKFFNRFDFYYLLWVCFICVGL